MERPIWIEHEDEHLLVVNKPPGINTHAAAEHAGEGLYEWLRRREPRWADLAIMQRLDKETSGVLLFSKSSRANASLTKQFTRRRVEKSYVLLTDRRPRSDEWVAESRIRKGQGRFESRSTDEDPEGLEARTRFVVEGEEPGTGWRLRAEPLTGRTHQIRLHAADHGVPILGDVLYGGSPWRRVCLHAASLRLRHPATNEPLDFRIPPEFERAPGEAVRAVCVDAAATDAFRMVHGAADGRPGWYVERLGDWLLASTTSEAGEEAASVPKWLAEMSERAGCRGLYARRLDRQVRGLTPAEASPRHVAGATVEGTFAVRENGLRYRLSFDEGYSCGLFLDQRENRRRLVTNWIGPGFPGRDGGGAGGELLNVFAYTCGFSVAAAVGGFRTTSLDLSKKYLDWGRENLRSNGLDPAAHDFIFGDAFDWLRRLGKKGRSYDVVVLDPPTFSQSRESGVFRAESDYARLAEAAARLVKPEGVLFASTNAARLEPTTFLAMVREGVRAAGRSVSKELYVPQPPDFPTHRLEPAYLKTVWMRLR